MKKLITSCAVIGLILAISGLIQEVSAEILNVSSNGTHVQSQSLLSGFEYIIEASGTYYSGARNDAAWYTWTYPTGWTEADDLRVNGQSINWLGTVDGENFLPHTFSPSHVYRYYVFGADLPVDFFIYDGYYPDNSGSLQVNITPEPATICLLSLGGLAVLRRRKTT
jgi:hypothetical protein